MNLNSVPESAWKVLGYKQLLARFRLLDRIAITDHETGERSFAWRFTFVERSLTGHAPRNSSGSLVNCASSFVSTPVARTLLSVHACALVHATQRGLRLSVASFLSHPR